MTSNTSTRKEFIKRVSVGSIGSLILPAVVIAQEKSPLKPELVKEFVIAGHGNLEKTKQMLDSTPAPFKCFLGLGQR